MDLLVINRLRNKFSVLPWFSTTFCRIKENIARSQRRQHNRTVTNKLNIPQKTSLTPPNLRNFLTPPQHAQFIRPSELPDLVQRVRISRPQRSITFVLRPPLSFINTSPPYSRLSATIAIKPRKPFSFPHCVAKGIQKTGTYYQCTLTPRSGSAPVLTTTVPAGSWGQSSL